MLPVLTIAALTALLPAAMAVINYDVWYHTVSGCNTRGGSQRLGCPGLPAYECCDAPPGASNFKYAIARSTGDVAVLGFHTPTIHGQCGALVSTGALNTCYRNEPFQPIAIYPLADIQRAKANGDSDLKVLGSITFGDFSPIFGFSPKRDTDAQNSTIPKGNCRKPDSLLLASGGMFKVEEEHLKEEFTRDVEDPSISDEALVEKYGLEVHPDAEDPRWWSYDKAVPGNKTEVIRSDATEST